MIDLSIIIVNFNTKDYLTRCVDSIDSTIFKYKKFEIIIVDNNSIDGSKEVIKDLKRKYSNLKAIINNENYGFSKANNQGIKISSESKYVLFLNPDTQLQENAIDEMIEFMENHKDAGAATCKLVMQNGKIDDAIHRGFPTPWNSFCHFSGLEKIFSKSKYFSGYSLGYLNLKEVHEIDALAGAFMLVRREAGKRVGWWDEDYFFYGEDIDFCYKLKQQKWKIYYVPDVFVLHYKGVSGGIKSVSKKITTASLETKKRVTKWRFNAMRIFYRKHYKEKYPFFINFLVDNGINLIEKIAEKRL